MLTLGQEQMEKRLATTEENGTRINGCVLPYYRGGRKEGDTNLPPELRTVIAIMANGPHGSIKSTADLFNVSKTHVQNLKNGRVNGPDHPPDGKLVHEVEKLKGTVYERALEKTLAALDSIDLKGTDAEEIKALPVIQKARLARDLSAVTKNMTPEHREVNIGQVVVMNPGERSEEDYKVVIVNKGK